MPVPKSSWKGYAAGAIVIWAVGLQVGGDLRSDICVCGCCRQIFAWPLIGRRGLVAQVSMWSLQKKPEFKQKFPELIDESRQPEVSLCYASNMLYQVHVMIQDTQVDSCANWVIFYWQTTTRVSYSSFNKPQ